MKRSLTIARISNAVAAFILLISGSIAIYAPSATADAFNPNMIVSDSTFENVNTMNAGQIDSLLNSYTSSCINQSHFSTPDPLGYSSTSNSYTFGGNVSGGQAVFDIAKNYHINPQVVLTTLQKEQSVVTGSAGCYSNTPDPSTAVNSPCGTAKAPCTIACPHSGGCMTIAMSYSCPNYCFAGIEGFSSQLSGGTWLLRFAEERAYGNLSGYAGFDTGDDSFSYSGPMTPGYRQRAKGGQSIYYDGSWTTSDGTSVTITNGATASLYTYTPFVNGNKSFTNLFQNTFGFGNPASGACAGSESPLPYVQRFYNPRTYEHFYSAYSCDINFLATIGFNLEGPVFNTTPCTAGYATPIYRFYNSKTGLHMWTSSNQTQAQLDAGGSGYQVEAGQVFCVAKSGMNNVHAVSQLYNPKTYVHIWVADPTMSDLGVLSQAGYSVPEGPVFYSQ